VGRDRVHELKIWTAEDGVGPLMQRMPATMDPAEIRDGVARLGGVYAPALVDRFHAGLNHLAHKHFVILSGLSGTGKTLLAIQYALTVHGFTSMDARDPLLFVCPVRPEWTDPSGLTGYEDRLSDRYVVPPFLEALLVATANPASPVFVILDEMNLARVEYYFSDVLSAVESRHELQLHSSGVPMEGSTGGEVPAHLRVPPNLFLIGTINVDETTSTLSDKVLDRAVVIDMSEVDFDAFFTALDGRHGDLAPSISACRPVLTEINALLIPHGLGFGYRLAEEFVRYHAFAVKALKRPSDEVIDDQLIQKALVRLRGTDAQRQLLSDLAKVLEDRPRARARIERLSQELEEFGAFQSSR
jgi:MoxR-like ATPase